MSRRTPRKTPTEKRLKHLYVLLGRICDIEQYVWEGIDHEEQYRIFIKKYDALQNQKERSGHDIETRFTISSVLYGTITLEDRKYKTDESLISHGDDIELKGETILHRAISFLSNDGETHNEYLYIIIDRIVQDLPFLLKCNRHESKEYVGQTPLHLAVLKENAKLVEQITKAMKNNDIPLDPIAKGSRFKGTVLSAGPPLCVAALTFNETIFKILVDNGANITATNEVSDNICHSLSFYAHHCPDRLDDICRMIDVILKYRFEGKKAGLHSNSPQRLLMMENDGGLNPLHLATKLQLPRLFKQFYGFEVYSERHLYESMQDDYMYDVTEIDTLPPGVDSEDTLKPLSENENNHASVLPAILLQHPQTAMPFLEFPPVRQVIELKWSRYKWIIAVFGILHLVFTILLTHSAIVRTQLTNDPNRNASEALSDPPNYKYRVGESVYVTSVSVISLVYSLIAILIVVRQVVSNRNTKVINQVTVFKYSHSNVLYRMNYVYLSVYLVLDFVMALSRVERYENYLLIAAVLVSWNILFFFLQMIKPFSFFTALIAAVMMDLFRFAVIMIILLFGFTTAMYMAMQGANTDDDTFIRYELALMKMFTVMIGSGDIDSLFLARQPALTVLIFITFVLMTTILLLNAALAVMSNTCSSLLSCCGNLTAHALHYRLQKLSAILLIEEALPAKLQKRVGELRPRKRYINGKWYNGVKRRVLYHTSLSSSMPDRESAILGHPKRRSNKVKARKEINPR